MLFQNFAGDSLQRNIDPAGNRSTRKVFEIDIKKQGLEKLTKLNNGHVKKSTHALFIDEDDFDQYF